MFQKSSRIFVSYDSMQYFSRDETTRPPDPSDEVHAKSPGRQLPSPSRRTVSPWVQHAASVQLGLITAALTTSSRRRSTLRSPTVGRNRSSWRVRRQRARAGCSSSRRCPILPAPRSDSTETVCSWRAVTRAGSHRPRDSTMVNNLYMKNHTTMTVERDTI